MSRKDDIKLITNHKRRLQILKEKQVLDGKSVAPEILLEIENIEAKIEDLQNELGTETPSRSSRHELKSKLKQARRELEKLEAQAGEYTVLTVPPSLVNEIDAKRQKIKNLEARLNDGRGGALRGFFPRRDLFWGRKEEIKSILGVLSPEDRKWGVMIYGLGGIGKTALAVEVAHICNENARFEDILFTTAKQTYLELGRGKRPMSDTAATLDAMLSNLARDLGKRDVAGLPGKEKRRALMETLQSLSSPEWRILLILDNLETLPAEEQRTVSDFLSHLPSDCKAIVTTRRRNVEGASPLQLKRLEWEAAQQLIKEEMEDNPELEKILSQAGEARWQELYDAIGGSPLALRWLLGFMWNRGLFVDRVLDRLRKEDVGDLSRLFRFIYHEAWQAMKPNHWWVLNALALFTTSATHEALVDVTKLPSLELESVLELPFYWALVEADKFEKLSNKRYSLHPLTRRLATDELNTHPEKAQKLQTRFNRYWLNYAQKYGGSDEDAYKTFDRLEAEWPNLDAAARSLWDLSGISDTLRDEEAAEMLIKLNRALRDFFEKRGYWDEQARLGEWAYFAAQALGKPQNAAWAAWDVIWVYDARDDLDHTIKWIERGVEAFEQGKSPLNLADAIQLRGLKAARNEDWAEAEHLYGEAWDAYRRLKDQSHQSRKIVILKSREIVILSDLGKVAEKCEKYDHAEKYYSEGFELAEELGDESYQAQIALDLGKLALDRGRLEEAHDWYECGRDLAQKIEQPDLTAKAQVGLARVLEKQELYDKALPLAEEALQIQEQLHEQDVEETRRLVNRLREKTGE